MDPDFLARLVSAWTFEILRSISVRLAQLESGSIDPPPSQFDEQYQRILPAVFDMLERYNTTLEPPDADDADMLVATLAEMFHDMIGGPMQDRVPDDFN